MCVFASVVPLKGAGPSCREGGPAGWKRQRLRRPSLRYGPAGDPSTPPGHCIRMMAPKERPEGNMIETDSPKELVTRRVEGAVFLQTSGGAGWCGATAKVYSSM